jgi:sulfoxide reductase heme-binding subunit YedZ
VTAVSSHILWYTTRATGVVALVLLSATVVLGVVTSVRFATYRWPRFALQDLHKRLSLLSVAFVFLHVVTTVSDSYAPIGWISAVVPFTSPYRRIWLGLGTLAVDLLLAVTVSSLLRNRISARSWRALHWLAYASWPVALVHGLGTGTDAHLGWMMLLTIVCVGAVLASVFWRLAAGWPYRAGERLVLGVASVVAVAGVAAWAGSGPLEPGWAARAGTPSSLLSHSGSGSTAPASTPAAAAKPVAASTPPTSAPNSSGGPPASPASSSSLPPPPYQVALSGSLTASTVESGLEQVQIRATTQGAPAGVLGVVILGTPDGEGGVVMRQGTASFGPPAVPDMYTGSVVGLDGTRISLLVHDAAGATVDLRLDLVISGNEVSGRLTARTSNVGNGDDY